MGLFGKICFNPSYEMESVKSDKISAFMGQIIIVSILLMKWNLLKA